MDDNLVSLIFKRELDVKACLPLKRKLHVTTSFVERLSLDDELDGHNGCVNCLEWDLKGRKLASASDDLHVIIWDPFKNIQLNTIPTGHHGNIFSVKFMPDAKEDIIVTGAGDCEIRVHNIISKETMRVCTCHTGRVKRLATAPYALNDTFWSAAEDGLIRQFDLRMPHNCQRNDQSVLIDLRTFSGGVIEAKCIDVNPVKPELIAVGANDPYIRLYDRRMIRLIRGPSISGGVVGTSEDNVPEGCVEYFVPGHIACARKPGQIEMHEFSSTYVVFGANGSDLLVNLGCEQIYLYDIRSKEKTILIRHANGNREITEPLKGYCNGLMPSQMPIIGDIHDRPVVPQRINELKLAGNNLFEKENYSKSIRLYNEAINRYPLSSVFYSNRAAAYMKRDWVGDTYAALRDCITALDYDSRNVKAYFRMTRCLFDLTWFEEAKLALETFKQKFPYHASLLACRALERDIVSTLRHSVDHVEETIDLDLRMDSKETIWRQKAKDYRNRYYGHCNTTTDIKEANFFGSEGQFIVAGSDDGSIFIWDRKTTNSVKILKGDRSIVNCVQPHPWYCLLATSGIQHLIRLWTPRPENGLYDDLEISVDHDEIADVNQRRMQADPFEVVLMNMGFRPRAAENDYSHQNSTDYQRHSNQYQHSTEYHQAAATPFQNSDLQNSTNETSNPATYACRTS